jgi:putative membrane protein
MNIKHWIISAVAILVVAYLLPGAEVTLLGAVILAVVLGLINVFIKPVVKLLALPLTILTLGLFSLVINALFVMLADAIVPGFSVSGFWTAFFFAILLSLVNALFGVGRKVTDTI